MCRFVALRNSYGRRGYRRCSEVLGYRRPFWRESGVFLAGKDMLPENGEACGCHRAQGESRSRGKITWIDCCDSIDGRRKPPSMGECAKRKYGRGGLGNIFRVDRGAAVNAGSATAHVRKVEAERLLPEEKDLGDASPCLFVFPREWWSRPGSNRRPRRCERRALSTALLPQGEPVVLRKGWRRVNTNFHHTVLISHMSNRKLLL